MAGKENVIYLPPAISLQYFLADTSTDAHRPATEARVDSAMRRTKRKGRGTRAVRGRQPKATKKVGRPVGKCVFRSAERDEQLASHERSDGDYSLANNHKWRGQVDVDTLKDRGHVYGGTLCCEPLIRITRNEFNTPLVINFVLGNVLIR
jgi:hypothetical protein